MVSYITTADTVKPTENSVVIAPQYTHQKNEGLIQRIWTKTIYHDD
jgi:hypothetical protein